MNYLYLRLSTNERRQATSMEAQQHAILERYPELAGTRYELVRDTVSGAKGLDRRPALAALFSALVSGDCVYIHSLDRLARDSTLSGWLRYEFAQRGVTLHSVRDNLRSDAQGRLIATIMSASAEHERDQIRSRVCGAFDVKRRRGEKLGGHVPYGYRVEIVAGRKYLVPDAAETAVIKKILSEYAKCGTYYGAAAALSKKGISGRDGNPISRQLIRLLVQRSTKPKEWSYTL